MGAQSTKARFSELSRWRQEDDLNLARAAAAGDDVARRKLVEGVYDRVRSTMVFVSNCADEVDDLTQNALVEVLRSVGSYRGEAPLAHWAERIAVRTAAKQFEKRRRRGKLFAAAYRDVPPEVDASTDEAAEYREMLHRFQLLIATLSEDNRLALLLHHVKGYPVSEIASLCNCSTFTVKGRLRRTRRWLKREILRDEVLAEWIEDKLGWSQP